MNRISTAALARALFFRHMPFLFEGAASLGVDEAPAVLVADGEAQAPVSTVGRRHHAIQADGLDGGEEWTVWGSLDFRPGTDPDLATWSEAATVTADGLTQLEGQFGYLRAEQTAGSPGSARLVLGSMA